MKRRFPWLQLRKKTASEPPLEPPIMLGNKSNGEFFHEQTPRERKIRELILREADEKARYVGVDRREFLASSMGMATALAVLNLADGCGDDDGTMNARDGGSDGGFDVPRDATVDCELADAILQSKDFFILDLQTHHIEDEEVWRDRHPGRTWTGAGFASALSFDASCTLPKEECIGPDTYIENVFLNSDTTLAVLSGFPSAICDDETLCTNLLGNDDMVRSRDRINGAAGGSQRVVQHCQVAPNDQWSKQKAMMARIREQFGNHGWKCYPPWGPDGKGFWLDDPEVADPFIEYCIELGEPLICAHKGFPLPSFDRVHTDPKDVGPAALKHPGARFVIYHSAFETGVSEREYGASTDASGAVMGVDRLCKTVLDNGLSGKNVYAETGSAWALTMSSPKQAQHYIGKLLKYVGEDNVCWGSECVWFGSPQPQIEAFRRLTISKELQEEFGYPELTDERKAKIFGLNGAKLYGIDPERTRCRVDQSKLAQLKQRLDGELGGRRWAFQQPGGPRTRAEFLRLQRLRAFLGKPA